MKKLSRCLWLGLVAICLLSLAGCGAFKSWDKQLIGSWYGVDEDNKPMIAVFKENGEYIGKTLVMDLKGSWEIADREKRHIKAWLPFLLGEADAKAAAPVEEVIAISGDKLTLRNLKDGTSQEFTRVPDNADIKQLFANHSASTTMPVPSTTPVPSNQQSSATSSPTITDDERKYIQMYSEVLSHMIAADKAVARFPLDSAHTVLAEASKHLDNAWDIHVKHFGTPERFYKTDSTLRLGLKKWREGINSMRNGHGKGEIDAALKLIAESEAEYKKQTAVLLGKI